MDCGERVMEHNCRGDKEYDDCEVPVDLGNSQFCLFDLSSLSKALTAFHPCPDSHVCLCENINERQSLQRSFSLKCRECSKVTIMNTGTSVENEKSDISLLCNINMIANTVENDMGLAKGTICKILDKMNKLKNTEFVLKDKNQVLYEINRERDISSDKKLGKTCSSDLNNPDNNETVTGYIKVVTNPRNSEELDRNEAVDKCPLSKEVNLKNRVQVSSRIERSGNDKRNDPVNKEVKLRTTILEGSVEEESRLNNISTVATRSTIDKGVAESSRAADINSLECKDCGKMFGSNRALTLHSRMKHITTNFACSICDRGFTHEHYLKRHMVKHDQSSRTCSTCSKVFSKKSNLVQHMRIHTGEKKYACEKCGKAFTDRSTLNVHMVAIHDGARKFVCDYCGSAFYHKGHFNVHLQKHKKDFRYLCSVCGKKFIYRQSLDWHQSVHTVNSFSCQYCPKTFRWKETWKRHTEAHEKLSVSTRAEAMDYRPISTEATIDILDTAINQTLRTQPLDSMTCTLCSSGCEKHAEHDHSSSCKCAVCEKAIEADASLHKVQGESSKVAGDKTNSETFLGPVQNEVSVPETFKENSQSQEVIMEVVEDQNVTTPINREESADSSIEVHQEKSQIILEVPQGNNQLSIQIYQDDGQIPLQISRGNSQLSLQDGSQGPLPTSEGENCQFELQISQDNQLSLQVSQESGHLPLQIPQENGELPLQISQSGELPLQIPRQDNELPLQGHQVNS